MSTNSPLIIVISAPSGTGKTTIVRELIKNNENLVASVSYTTRKKRANEINGKDYNFVSSELFSSMAEEKSFLEHVKVFILVYVVQGLIKPQLNFFSAVGPSFS